MGAGLDFFFGEAVISGLLLVRVRRFSFGHVVFVAFGHYLNLTPPASTQNKHVATQHKGIMSSGWFVV